MKFQILFRGKTALSKWVEGDVIHGVRDKCGLMYILPKRLTSDPECHHLDGYLVVPETIGRLVCSVGERNFFAGDIVSRGGFYNSVIVDDGFCFRLCSVNNLTKGALIHKPFDEQDFVIGNIFDNPELLK